MSVTLIVVVEDKEEEQAKALEAIKHALVPSDDENFPFDAEKNAVMHAFKKAQVMVQFAPDLAKARERLALADNFNKKGVAAVCVLTDLMFPANKEGKEEPNGLSVLAICIEMGLPVVVCSDTDHHDVNYLLDVFPVLGKAHPKGEIPVILDKKDWNRATVEILRMLGKHHADPSQTA